MATRKTVLITGCSSGIGHSLALEFHARGLRVFATARSASSLTDLSDLGIETFSLDVTDAASIAALKKEISALTGTKLNFLVNNAGRNYTVPALDLDLAEVEQMFATNLFAVMAMCQAFAPLLIAAKGTIVQIGSLAALMPYAFGSAYNASKAALHAYSATLRVELAPLGVHVVVVVTGGVISNIARTRRDLPEGSLYLPLQEEYVGRQTHSQANGVPSEKYAKEVVESLVGSSGRDEIWGGGGAWLVWFVTGFLPRWVMDYAMTRMFHLWKLSPSGKAKKLT